MMRIKSVVAVAIICLMSSVIVHAQAPLLTIGEIQGSGDVSPYLNRFVNFRGVVAGRYEDENTRGDVYHTLFVQNLPDAADDDPATSDGIAVFLGREPRHDIEHGAQVLVGGKVTEFYGLTEIDDDGLVVVVEGSGGPIPKPVIIDPPADMTEQAVYFEALEGMRVAFEDIVIVAGPTHTGCGFAVTAGAAAADLPAVRRADDDPVGSIVPVLYPSDRECDDIPQVKTGDHLLGMAGVLTYNFDQFKIVIDSAEQLTHIPASMPAIPPLPTFDPAQIILVSINTEDYFDSARDTEEEGEPVLSLEELNARQFKLAHVIARVLNCPTIIALQEVEHERLLGDLSAVLVGSCGFVYQVSHLESPDARGIDNALLSDSRRVEVKTVNLRQVCSPVPTGVIDTSLSCDSGQQPLFGRPPLQIEALIDGDPYMIFVNHFKSKRGGEIETDLERIRQAVYLNGLATELLSGDESERIIALGDFNDTDLSPALMLLTDTAQEGRFSNALAAVPAAERYTFNFGGVVELIDAILLSPTLIEEMGWASIVHTNTDFPIGWRLDTSPDRLLFRVSDHDIPVVALGRMPVPSPEPSIEPTAEPATAYPTPAVAPAIDPTAGILPSLEAAPGSPTPSEMMAIVTADTTPAARQPSSNREGALWLALLVGCILIAAIFMVVRLRH